jgi:hypothetical protein
MLQLSQPTRGMGYPEVTTAHQPWCSFARTRSSVASAASRSPAVPAPENKASIFLSFSRSPDCVDTDRPRHESPRTNATNRGRPRQPDPTPLPTQISYVPQHISQSPESSSLWPAPGLHGVSFAPGLWGAWMQPLRCPVRPFRCRPATVTIASLRRRCSRRPSHRSLSGTRWRGSVRRVERR